MDEVDGLVASVCTRNHAAPEQARQRDDEARAGRSRGPLHGRPVLVKDNVDTADLPTTAGSMALAGLPHPSRDAALVRRLRDAGMVVVGKANLSEWANIRDHESTSGWSAYGGLTRNPYGLNRSAGGSSSGSGAAVGAGITPFAVGTETDGSITCPAAFNGCVGFKPTVGLVPTDGVVPVSASQDSPGPMAMTVRDAAALLGVLAGDGTDYASYAVEGRLAGKRIGVPRRDFWGYSLHADEHAERAVALLAAEGATIVDHTDLDSLAGLPEEDELLVMLAELRDRPAALPRHPRRRRPAHAGRRGRRSTASTPTSSSRTSASRCSSRRSRAPGSTARSTPRRGHAAWPTPATTASTRCSGPTTSTRWSPRRTPRRCRSTW